MIYNIRSDRVKCLFVPSYEAVGGKQTDRLIGFDREELSFAIDINE